MCVTCVGVKAACRLGKTYQSGSTAYYSLTGVKAFEDLCPQSVSAADLDLGLLEEDRG